MDWLFFLLCFYKSSFSCCLCDFKEIIEFDLSDLSNHIRCYKMKRLWVVIWKLFSLSLILFSSSTLSPSCSLYVFQIVYLKCVECEIVPLKPPQWWVIFSGLTGSRLIVIQTDGHMWNVPLCVWLFFFALPEAFRRISLGQFIFIYLLSCAWKVKLLLGLFKKNVWPEGPCYLVFLFSPLFFFGRF